MLPILTSLPGETRGYAPGPAGQIHYRQMGEGRPLILAHQAPWSSIQYHRAMPLLAARGFRVIVPDMPGHGFSTPPTGAPGIPLYAETVLAVMDALEIGQAAVAGQHGGSLVAGRIAAVAPDRVTRIAMDNAPLYSAEERAGLAGSRSDPQLIATDGSHFAERWDMVRRFGDPAWSDVTVHLAVVTSFLNGPWRNHGFEAAQAYDFEADLPRIACPALVISGRTDILYAHGHRILDRMPHFAYGEFRAGPAMVYDYTDEWVAVMAPFLAGEVDDAGPAAMPAAVPA